MLGEAIFFTLSLAFFIYNCIITLSRFVKLSVSESLSLSVSQSLILSFSHSLTLSFSHSLTLLSLFSHSSLTLWLYGSLTLSLKRSMALWLFGSLTVSVPFSLEHIEMLIANNGVYIYLVGWGHSCSSSLRLSLELLLGIVHYVQSFE
jgi:hypothetical protein